MAFIVRGKSILEKVNKKIVAIGTGESTQNCIKSLRSSIQGIDTITFHRSMQYVFKTTDIGLTYWTWSDPDASLEGLKLYENESNLKRLPTIIIPKFLSRAELSQYRSTSTKVFKDKKVSKTYDSLIQLAEKANKVCYIEDSIYSPREEKDVRVLDPKVRFEGNTVVFGSVGKGAVDWNKYSTYENRFTSTILPICHYLKYNEVFNLGFDNKGRGISRNQQVHTKSEGVKFSLELVKKWKEDWYPYHKMSIFSIIPDKYTNLNSILEKKSIDELT